jgi:hypothetical protein
MNNKYKCIVTCRFPAWGDNNEYPAFGVKYLVECPNECLDKENGVYDYFREEYSKVIGGEFKGEVLFIESAENLVVL